MLLQWYIHCHIQIVSIFAGYNIYMYHSFSNIWSIIFGGVTATTTTSSLSSSTIILIIFSAHNNNTTNRNIFTCRIFVCFFSFFFILLAHTLLLSALIFHKHWHQNPLLTQSYKCVGIIWHTNTRTQTTKQLDHNYYFKVLILFHFILLCNNFYFMCIFIIAFLIIIFRTNLIYHHELFCVFLLHTFSFLYDFFSCIFHSWVTSDRTIFSQFFAWFCI